MTTDSNALVPYVERPRGVVKQAARTAGRKAAYHAARSPVYAGRAVARGARGWVLSWSPLLRWLMDEREYMVYVQALSDGKATHTAQKALDKRDRNIKIRLVSLSLVLLVTPVIIKSQTILEWSHCFALVWGAIVLGQAVYGATLNRTDPPITEMPTARETGDVSLEDINGAMEAIRAIDRPNQRNPTPPRARLTTWPESVDGGQEVRFELPKGSGKSAAYVLGKREEIAAEFAVPVQQIELTKGTHEGEVRLWRGDSDPFDAPVPSHPLLDAAEANALGGSVFGMDVRGRPVDPVLFETNVLVGGIMASGKTTGARSLLSSVILDPYARLHVFNGKMSRDWKATEKLAATYENRDIDEQAPALVEQLNAWLSLSKARNREMSNMSDADCPENKLTLDMHRNGMPLEVMVIDEGQEFVGHPEHGETVTDLMVKVARLARSAGLVFVFITQRPDSDLAKTFTALRSIMATRIAFRVMDWQSSNMILGDQMNTSGFNAAEIAPEHVGACILRPGTASDQYAKGRRALDVRSYNMTGAEWAALCNIGYELRQSAKPAPSREVIEIAPNPEPKVWTRETLVKDTGRMLWAVVDAMQGERYRSTSGILGAIVEPWASLTNEEMGRRLTEAGLPTKHNGTSRVRFAADALEAAKRVRKVRPVPVKLDR